MLVVVVDRDCVFSTLTTLPPRPLLFTSSPPLPRLGELAYDMSWPAVRVAVLEGLTLLVDNPHAQPVMKKALPQLASLLADPSLKVRRGLWCLGGLTAAACSLTPSLNPTSCAPPKP